MQERDAPSGVPLRLHRERLGLTQLQLAEQLARLAWLRRREHVGVNADMVSKWERGTKAVSPLYREMYCALFDADGIALGFITDHSELQETDGLHPGAGPAGVLEQLGPAVDHLGPTVMDAWKEEAMKRRTLIKMMGSAPAALAASGHSPRSAAPAIHGLDELADRYQALYHSASPLDLMAPVVTHLRTIDRLIRQGLSPVLRHRLLVNRSRVGTLAGRIAFFDLGDPISARGYFTTAAEAAGEADEPLLAAAALGHMAFVPAAEHSYSAAQDYMRGANRQLDRLPHPGVKAWLAAVESEILTNAGSSRLALQACDQAEAALRSEPGEHLAWFDYFDATRLNGFRGYAELQAGRLDDARRTLGAAADALPEHAVKQRVVFLADIASVELERNELDEACRLATLAAETLQVAGYATGSDRLEDLRDRMEPWAERPAVRVLDERMDSR